MNKYSDKLSFNISEKIKNHYINTEIVELMSKPSDTKNCIDCKYSCMQNIFTREDFEYLDANKIEIEYHPGEIIIKQGSFISEILFLKKGLIKIVLESKNGKNTILKIVKSGNFIALPVLNNHKNYPLSVISLSPVNVCKIHKDSMLDIIKRNFLANDFLLNWYSGDYLFLYNRISLLSTRNNHGKLCSSLLYLMDIDFFGGSIFKYISRKDLAELSSVSLDSVNKILLELKNDKIIEINGRYIKVLKRDLIETLSNIG